MKEINLEEILQCKETYDSEYPTISISDAIEAMREACSQVLDLATENAELDYYEDSDTGEIENIHIVKNSILQIKEWIK